MKPAQRLHLRHVLAGATIMCAARMSAQGRPYDPLAIVQARKAETLDLSVKDAQRGREIPLRVYLPAAKAPAPVVLFSHGLGGSREGSPYLGEHWSARGYVVVFLQHGGSDDAVWKDIPPAQRMASMKRAANVQNALLRYRDVSVVIDELERLNKSSASPLAGRMDLKHIGMSGHSFGAGTTQGVSGQRTARGTAPFTDARITAALAMSPSSPSNGGDPKRAFGGVTIPWLLMTGTKDVALVGDADVASRLAVFPALPPGGKYELVLDGAEHSAFSDRALPGDTEKRNPNHHRAILAVSTAFWDAWLREDADARAWLDGNGPRSVLETRDRWQRK
jgi:predicted dienelactone hydrolase